MGYKTKKKKEKKKKKEHMHAHALRKENVYPQLVLYFFVRKTQVRNKTDEKSTFERRHRERTTMRKKNKNIH